MADDDTDKKWWKDKEKLVPGLIGAAVRATPSPRAPSARDRNPEDAVSRDARGTRAAATPRGRPVVAGTSRLVRAAFLETRAGASDAPSPFPPPPAQIATAAFGGAMLIAKKDKDEDK